MAQPPSLVVGSDAQHRTPERRQAIWPWLVMPLAALALFVILHAVTVHSVHRPMPTGSGALAESPATPAR